MVINGFDGMAMINDSLKNQIRNFFALCNFYCTFNYNFITQREYKKILSYSYTCNVMYRVEIQYKLIKNKNC